MSFNRHLLNIDQLIDIVRQGGTVRTGVDIYNRENILLLEKNVLINSIKPLLVIREKGACDIEINPDNQGGIWDQNGRDILPIPLPRSAPAAGQPR